MRARGRHRDVHQFRKKNEAENSWLRWAAGTEDSRTSDTQTLQACEIAVITNDALFFLSAFEADGQEFKKNLIFNYLLKRLQLCIN